MSCNPNNSSLGSLIEIKHGFAFKGEFFSETPTPYQLTTPGNFAIGGGFQAGKGKYYSGSIPNDYILSEGDLVVTMTDLSKAADTLGYAATIPKTPNTTWLHNQRVGLIKIKPNAPVSKQFIHYLMRSPKYRHWVVSTASGSTVKHTSPSRICEYEFYLPPIHLQNEIASTLCTFDERINLLRQTNITLEKIASSIFKSWFINFDPVRAKSVGDEPENIDAEISKLFPESFIETEFGRLPSGWRFSSVDKVFKLTMGQSPPGDTYNTNGNGVPFYQGRTDFGFRFPKQRVHCTSPARFAKSGDTLVSVRAPVGDVNMAIEDCCIGRGLASLHHEKYKSFAFYSARNLESHFQNFDSEGTIFGSINKKSFEDLPIVLPEGQLLDIFEDTVRPIDTKIVANELLIRSLAELRDLMLPRLISGQLGFNDAELKPITV